HGGHRKGAGRRHDDGGNPSSHDVRLIRWPKQRTAMAQGTADVRVNLHQLLKAMVEKGASDMHITAGAPPLLRIDGEVIPLKLPPLTPAATKQLCSSIMSE